MDCPECGATPLVVTLPTSLCASLANDPEIAAICRRCLTVSPSEGPVTDDPTAIADLSTALPDDPDTAIEVALLVTLCESLALHRTEIEQLVAQIERAGVDPLLTLGRLANDPDLELALDVERRRPQLTQLLQ